MKKLVIILGIVLLLIAGAAIVYVSNNPINLKPTKAEADLNNSIKKEGALEIIFGENKNIVDKDSKFLGVHNNVISSNIRINNAIVEKLREKGIILEDKSFNIDENENKSVRDLIENDESLLDIKKLTNGKYSIYTIDKKVGEFYGKYLTGVDSYNVEFNDNNANGFFINGDYNHMPRNVDVYMNTDVNSFDKTTTITKYKEYDEAKLKEIGIKLVGDEREINIVQVIKSDINNDGKIETIVNYNNYLGLSDAEKQKVWENASINPPADGYTNLYGIIVILDNQNRVLDYIQNVPHVRMIIPSDCGKMHTRVGYICDIDNDNIMDVISYIYEYSSWGYKVSKLNADMILSKDTWFVH